MISISPLLIDHGPPLTSPCRLVLFVDPHAHGFDVGVYVSCNAHHLVRPRATKVRQHGRDHRIHIRYWVRYVQTLFCR